MKRNLIMTGLVVCLCALIPVQSWGGYHEGLKAYQQGDYRAAAREFERDAGPQASFHLSMMYETGNGVPQDREKSLEWLQRAADQKLDVAQANLGMMYLTGQGVERNDETGMKWLQRAADQGLEEARAALEMDYAQLSMTVSPGH